MTRIKETEIKQGLGASQNKANLQKLISYILLPVKFSTMFHKWKTIFIKGKSALHTYDTQLNGT